MDEVWQHHRLRNWLQTLLLVLVLLGILALAGELLFGRTGFWLALGAGLLALLVEPAAAARLTLSLYRARPLSPAQAPQLWWLLEQLARRAGLEQVPQPCLVPSRMVNAFAVGSRQQPYIALTDGLLRLLPERELTAVLAHEIAHIAHGDLRVMGLADSVSRLTGVLAFIAQLTLLLALPWVLSGSLEINWLAFLLLALAPHLALLAQLGLSRVREYDADLLAARLTGDPIALAAALAHIEQVSHWHAWLWPGWRTPEPSWLRTHPATEERIARLQQLRTDPQRWLSPPSLSRLPSSPQVVRRPRWYPGGYWH